MEPCEQGLHGYHTSSSRLFLSLYQMSFLLATQPSQGCEDIPLSMDRANINVEGMQLCPATRKDISDRLHRAVQCLVLDRSMHGFSRVTEHLVSDGSLQHLIRAIVGIVLEQGYQHIHLEFGQHFLCHQTMYLC